jgi:hypothetical protein
MSVVKAVAVTVACAAALSLVYGPAEFYSPLAYLNIVLAGLMGLAVGHCGKTMLRRFRVDGTAAAFAVGLIGGAAALWFSWLTYAWVLSGYNFGAFAEYANPAALRDLLGHLSENPVWSLSRRGRAVSDDSALLYYAVWLAEAGAFVYLAVRECTGFAAENKLCPQCRDWLRPTGEVARFLPADPFLLASAKKGDLQFLTTGHPRLAANADAREWLEAGNHVCGNCEGLPSHVTLTRCRIVVDKKKKPELKTKVVASMVEVSSAWETAIFSLPEEKSGNN